MLKKFRGERERERVIFNPLGFKYILLCYPCSRSFSQVLFCVQLWYINIQFDLAMRSSVCQKFYA